MMQLQVIERDKLGNISNKKYDIGLARLLKHVGIAGQIRPLWAFSTLRGLGFLLYFHNYIDAPIFSWKAPKFRRDSLQLIDPTDISHFSNIIGRAIGDMLARRISGAKYTHTYENALLVRNIVCLEERPDFYCDTGKVQFAMEVKGYSRSSVSDNKMSDIKNQAASGPLPVPFYIACATYGVFDHPLKAKYYDPENENVEYDQNLSIVLARAYYSNIYSEVSSLKELRPVIINNVECQAYSLDTFGLFGHKIIISTTIRKWLLNDTRNGELPVVESIESDDLFLDSDGIGIELE
jgi:hypothetical protein